MKRYLILIKGKWCIWKFSDRFDYFYKNKLKEKSFWLYYWGILVTPVQPSRHNDFFGQLLKLKILHLKHQKMFNFHPVGRKWSVGKLNSKDILICGLKSMLKMSRHNVFFQFSNLISFKFKKFANSWWLYCKNKINCQPL